jgi:hypothetical protein
MKRDLETRLGRLPVRCGASTRLPARAASSLLGGFANVIEAAATCSAIDGGRFVKPATEKTRPALILYLLAFVLGLQTLRADCVSAPPGLVSWWRAEDNALDQVGTNHGALRNGAAFAPGQVGQAFSFDGEDDYLEVGAGFNLDGLTLEAWVLIDPATNTGEKRILSKDNIGLGGTRKAMVLKSSAPSIAGGQGRAAFVVLIGNAVDAVEAPFALTAGWHHLAGVRDTDVGRFELYVDGVMLTNQPIISAIGPIDSVVSMVIGQVNTTYNGEFFAGLIDEPAIYSRALSAAEVRAIFNAGSAGKCPAPSLTIFRSTTNTAVVLWPSPSTGFGLQQNTNSLGSVNWSNVTAINDDGTNRFIIVNPPAGNRFFRLQKP